MSATVATISTLDSLKALVLNGMNSPHSRRAYQTALRDFFLWYEDMAAGQTISKAMVQEWVSYLRDNLELSPATINVRLSAIRKLVAEAADNQLLDQAVASAVSRVRGVKKSGDKTGNWLTREQAEQLLRIPNKSTKGIRDRALLGVLVGCGLRRSELANLTMKHIQMREARWVILDIEGKGSRVRTVPMPSWAKTLIDAWTESVGITEGPVFRPIDRHGKVSTGKMTEAGVYDIVRTYADKLGIDVRPHDLRRTFAKLAHKGRAPIEQIQLSLGHSSIQTTERYLGVEQDLASAPCDRLGIRIR